MKKNYTYGYSCNVCCRCELLSPKEWSEYNKRRSERGVKCYEDENGYVYCEDKYGNRH